MYKKQTKFIICPEACMITQSFKVNFAIITQRLDVFLFLFYIFICVLYIPICVCIGQYAVEIVAWQAFIAAGAHLIWIKICCLMVANLWKYLSEFCKISVFKGTGTITEREREQEKKSKCVVCACVSYE